MNVNFEKQTPAPDSFGAGYNVLHSDVGLFSQLLGNERPLPLTVMLDRGLRELPGRGLTIRR